MTGITVGHHGEHLVAVKHADEPDRRARLRQEATVLAKLDHPGVVRLVGFEEGPPATLRTTFVGPDSWLHHPPTGDARFDDLAVVVATVADLHDAGVTHGALEPTHVLVGEGRPILCGLADAGPATSERIHEDRRALAGLVESLGTDEALLVETIADLTDPAVSLRAVARRLDTRSTTPTRPPRRFVMPDVDRRLVVRAAVATFVVAIGALVATSFGDAATETAVEAPPPTSVTAGGTPSSTVPDSTTTLAVPADAPVVEHGGRRYAIGRPGDLVVLGDWSCDGVATPAVLRPTTGDVAVFTEWPAADAQITAALVTSVDGADAFVETDELCPDLRVRTAAGSHLIDLPEG